MNALWLVIAIHAGLLGAGFGLVAILHFQNFEESKPLESAAMALDPTGIAAVGLAICNIFKNWRQVRTGRHFTYAALIFVAVMCGALYLRNG